MPVALSPEQLAGLQDKATAMRIDSVLSTTEAGSGHPTTCASAAEIMSALFFQAMRYDPKDPGNPANDVFILSKGHAARCSTPAWAEAGYIPKDDLLNLRKIDSDLEGHPPTVWPFVDVATGSLGQGLSVGLGMAAVAKLDGRDQRIYVLMGDGETAEGSVWEAAASASYDGLNNLIATIDVNRLGQSAPTMLGHDMDAYKRRWEAFGWQALIVDGHDVQALVDAYDTAAATTDKPTVVLAKTYKGKGIPLVEDGDDWHGKPIPKGEAADNAIKALESQLQGSSWQWEPNLPTGTVSAPPAPSAVEPPPYQVGARPWRRVRHSVRRWRRSPRPTSAWWCSTATSATRPTRGRCWKSIPKRFFQTFIAEQTMVGAAMGAACRGKVAFAASFACFLARAYDFMRMAAISGTNVKLVGTHAGVSIGEDGASQMGLEDLAMTAAEPNYTVFYPSDATSAWRGD